MYNIENNFDADIGQLRQIASRFCPEELKSVVRQVIPDEFDAINLKQLESDHLIIRTEYPQIPPKVEYSLSERGRSLMDVLDQLCVWGENNKE